MLLSQSTYIGSYNSPFHTTSGHTFQPLPLTSPHLTLLRAGNHQLKLCSHRCHLSVFTVFGIIIKITIDTIRDVAFGCTVTKGKIGLGIEFTQLFLNSSELLSKLTREPSIFISRSYLAYSQNILFAVETNSHLRPKQSSKKLRIWRPVW